jgi:hypothetical protein
VVVDGFSEVAQLNHLRRLRRVAACATGLLRSFQLLFVCSLPALPSFQMLACIAALSPPPPPPTGSQFMFLSSGFQPRAFGRSWSPAYQTFGFKRALALIICGASPVTSGWPGMLMSTRWNRGCTSSWSTCCGHRMRWLR